MARRSPRNALLGKIHLGLKQLVDQGVMTKDDYRLMLEDRYGYPSASQLTVDQLKLVVEHLEKLGAIFTKKPTADDPQARLIRHLWLKLHAAGKVRNPSEAALSAFVKRQVGVDRLDWLSPRQASDVIEHLKQWLER
jgi:phage gp16-like protein